jgi:hypothetical protein
LVIVEAHNTSDTTIATDENIPKKAEFMKNKGENVLKTEM